MSEFIKENYHTHTWRCKHALGTEREYVEAAIQNGIKVLGFSDHIPCPYPDDYVSTIRMDMEQAEDYVRVVKELALEYKEQITIKVGFEVEYIPEFFEKQMKMTEDLGCDYLIMGQHSIGPENHSPYVGARTYDESILETYVDYVLAGANTGRFKYVAHPDLIYFAGAKAVYEKHMRRLCEGLHEINLPIEINVLGIRTNRNYPSPVFWEIAGEVGNDVIIGMDAHSVSDLVDHNGYQEAVRIAEHYHLKRIN